MSITLAITEYWRIWQLKESADDYTTGRSFDPANRSLTHRIRPQWI
ncbi:hypothetical protein [Chamaesiphon minutus]|nr:hypothetical protein [Chamaesiphon minutus]